MIMMIDTNTVRTVTPVKPGPGPVRPGRNPEALPPAVVPVLEPLQAPTSNPDSQAPVDVEGASRLRRELRPYIGEAAKLRYVDPTNCASYIAWEDLSPDQQRAVLEAIASDSLGYGGCSS